MRPLVVDILVNLLAQGKKVTVLYGVAHVGLCEATIVYVRLREDVDFPFMIMEMGRPGDSNRRISYNYAAIDNGGTGEMEIVKKDDYWQLKPV